MENFAGTWSNVCRNGRRNIGIFTLTYRHFHLGFGINRQRVLMAGKKIWRFIFNVFLTSL